jgi:hypothetical protein
LKLISSSPFYVVKNEFYLVNVVENVGDFFVSQLDAQFLNAELEIVE